MPEYRYGAFGKRKLTEEEALAVLVTSIHFAPRGGIYLTHREAAERYGVSYGTVRAIRRGDIWKENYQKLIDGDFMDLDQEAALLI